MRRIHRSDGNQKAIVDGLRKLGCDVEIIGRPVDLLVGYRARNFLIEIKDPKGENKLSQGQKDFIASWRGQVRVARSLDECVRLVTEAYEET